MFDIYSSNVAAATKVSKPCPVVQQPVKKESALKLLIRRLKESVKPTHCSVRYDTSQKLWAEVKANGVPVRHFDHGIMSHVEFSTLTITEKRASLGCGGGSYETETMAGIATGDLISDSYGSDAIGFRNLEFKDGQFLNAQGHAISRASQLRLMPDRRALYKE